eukprot:TRINITY_DN12363_c0_g1_i1.p1 TRINITY_DN12363_c0_g1~~TRINITY_DN12363_c0_g1_i1.p1  ORF type:complete len:495 (+),score=84.73 TRINITY_DN12363_c0_g1_i1:587-2071(+)
MVDAVVDAFQLYLKMPSGQKLSFEALSHDSVADVKNKVRMKLKGVVFEDDVTKRTVELFTFGRGLMCTVNLSRWNSTAKEPLARIMEVELDGRLLRLGGAGHPGVALPKLARSEHKQFITRLRNMLEDGRVTHNIPPPIGLHHEHDRTSHAKKEPRDVLLLSGATGHQYANDRYIHNPSCSGLCGGRCYPAGQPAQSWGALFRGAAARGDVQEVKRLLSAGTRPDETSDATGKSALHHAARHGHKEVVRVLLAAGCYGSFPDKEGNTPAECARLNKHTEVQKMIEASMKYSLSPTNTKNPKWLLRDLRHSHSKDMTDLTSQPWVVGITVQVSPNREEVEKLCRAAWAGWSKRKEQFVGQRGVILTIRNPTEDSTNGALLEVSFDEGDKFWFPAKAVVSPYGRGEERSVYAATNNQKTAESLVKWRVLFAGRELEDRETLWETGIQNYDTLQLLKGDGGYEPWGAVNTLSHNTTRPPRDGMELPPDNIGFVESFY